MNKNWWKNLQIGPILYKWVPLTLLVALMGALASALFLSALKWVTQIRISNNWLIFLLPLAGYLVAKSYVKWGAKVEAGNNKVLLEIANPTEIIPLRMAPMILFSTLISHLMGASVGREGTAVQMGASLADQLTRFFKITAQERSTLLIMGVSAGFASVFGTPWTGAVFAIEFLIRGRLRIAVLIPSLVTALLANQIGNWLGIAHTHYAVSQFPSLSLWLLAVIILCGIVFGLVAKAFAEALHALTGLLKRFIPAGPWRAALGGLIIAGIILGFGAHRYAGIGIDVIQEAFKGPVLIYDFAAKWALTIFSLAVGFKGGEVTPLFYIGATLGNALAPLLDMPFSFIAALGFVGVFAGATNTPIACSIMAAEMFGWQIGLLSLISNYVSFWISGNSCIYKAQLRIDRKRNGDKSAL